MSWRPLIGFVLLTGCMTSRPDAGVDGPDGSPALPDWPLYVPGLPGIGTHTLAFRRLHSPTATTLATDPIRTVATSTIIASVGRGDASGFARPTDNKGNAPYPQLDTT